MEAENQNPSQINRFHMDGVHMTNIVEWSKKRKLQMDQLDSLRPKHKCWVQSSPSKRAPIFDERMYNHLDDRSSPESAKDSNSFSQDSNTSMSVNEEVKLEADCAKTSSLVNWDGYNVKDVAKVEKTGSSEEDMFADKEYNELYHDAEMQALQNLEEHILGLGNCTDQLYSEYAKDSTNMYVLSSGRWEVNQEAESSKRAPTIDQEFEQYFSMLML